MSTRFAALALALTVLAACGSRGPIVVPETVDHREAPRQRIASGLANPRGMLARDDGSLLVATAGTGEGSTGALLRLRDVNGDGDFDDDGERTPVLEALSSANVLSIVRRDEVFGAAAIAEGGGEVLATHAMFGAPTTVYAIEGDRASKWSFVHGNLNALAYHPARREWFATSSSSDELVLLAKDSRQRRVVKFPPLADGQDAVPGYVRHDPTTGDLLVSLFSGSTEGEEGGRGTEIPLRAGSIVAVEPDGSRVTPIVEGLTLPTDLLVADDSTLYVLELSHDLLDPIGDRAGLARSSHGGFRRFSGRLLRVDRETGEVVAVATGLDAPTSLAFDGGAILVAEGMGTPGRPIPSPRGPIPLQGFIERVRIAAR